MTLHLAQNEKIIRQYSISSQIDQQSGLLKETDLIVTNKRIVKTASGSGKTETFFNTEQCFIENIHNINYGVSNLFSKSSSTFGIVAIILGFMLLIVMITLEFITGIAIGAVVIIVGIIFIFAIKKNKSSNAYIDIISKSSAGLLETNTVSNISMRVSLNSNNENIDDSAFYTMINELTALIFDIKELGNAVYDKWINIPDKNIISDGQA